MNPTCYVSTTFAADDSALPAVLAACRDHGITRLELGSNHAHMPDPAAALAPFADFDFVVHNYFPPPPEPFVVNIASADDAERARSLAFVTDAIAFCTQIGAPLYTMHPGFAGEVLAASRDDESYDFHFADEIPGATQREAALQRFLAAMPEILATAREQGVRIALETQGSYRKPQRLLLQRPAEFQRVMDALPADDTWGFSLNIGHLQLAGKTFGDPWRRTVDLIAERLVAMELSHNDGIDDQHLPLAADAWYWPLIRDPRFADALKILEFRDASLDQVRDNATLLSRRLS